MSRSIHVIGFAPPDGKWRSMKSVWDSCTLAGIEIPEEVENFFNGVEPDDAGVEVDLEKSGAVEEWSADCQEGYEVDLSKVPSHVNKIRFCISY